ncbi:amidohydrolase [Kineococcus sp. R8]|uniref:M20 metallopeptidase family protein n=1 Tax=Kineococcus siccus TaxID=2696567 RepID=UPI001411B75F|nr:M20 family metallopeptidase [Kineococcus siccus]NAZ82983.1 amidohydrolase [Kineococcus siccus]
MTSTTGTDGLSVRTASASDALSRDAAGLLPELVALRRALHAAPEVGLDLPATQRAVLDALAGLDLEITLGTRTTSVVAVLRGRHPGPAVLLRGDMDALPVVEQTGLDYASTNGAMHACGHDLHTAGLVGAVRLLHERRSELAGSVVFMFQPGEEGLGGAKIMLEEGLLDAAGERPVAAFAIHVGPGEAGVFSTRAGTIAAGSNQLHVTVHGAGGHGSKPDGALDPVPAVAEIVTALQAMVTRRFSVLDPIVLTVTQLRAGTAINVIPASASLGATVRTLSVESTDRVEREAQSLAAGIAAAHGCTAEVRFVRQYPVTVNAAGPTTEVVRLLGERFGEDRVHLMPAAMMGSEDFSFVLEQVPGTFFSVGASPAGVDPATAAWNHSPQVLFDDAVLADQAVAFAHLALSWLAPARG